MSASTSHYTFVRSVRDWTLVLGVLGVTVWGFTLPDLPVDITIRHYLNEKAQNRDTLDHLISQERSSATPEQTDAIAAGANQTALLHATRSGDLDQVQSLLREGEDVNAEDADGNTPLIWAVRNQNVAAVRLLLAQSGINAGCQNHEGTSAYAFASDNEEITTLLDKHNSVHTR